MQCDAARAQLAFRVTHVALCAFGAALLRSFPFDTFFEFAQFFVELLNPGAVILGDCTQSAKICVVSHKRYVVKRAKLIMA